MIFQTTEYEPPTRIVTWGGGTDEQIEAMVQAADQGKINLADYWSVGDERQVTLSAMEATGVGESHVEQTVTLVLMNVGGKELANATASGRTTCSFIVGQKGCLAETGYMNSSNGNSGSWEGSERRAWCNSVYYNAIPSTLRPIFKQFKNITAKTYNGTTNQTSVDYFALPAEKEVFGTNYSNSTEANALTRFEWYDTASNRIKQIVWWTRSPYRSDSLQFCMYSTGGYYNYASATYLEGISPFGCI